MNSKILTTEEVDVARRLLRMLGPCESHSENQDECSGHAGVLGSWDSFKNHEDCPVHQLREIIGLRDAELTRVEIDLNSRSPQNHVRARVSKADGEMRVGAPVRVFESEGGVVGDARIVSFDPSHHFVYLDVDWESLR